MVRTVTDGDIGMKVLREAPTEAESAQVVDIVAIHGLGAHPDDTWCKNIGTVDEPKWFNWLTEDEMLPKLAPHARTMRYGYKSGWFGKEATHQSVSTVAERLLKALRRKRKDIPFRPLIFVAHCFGGLVVLKALLEAEQYQKEWTGIFPSTTGLMFFGTPFRGAGGMNQMEMLAAARLEYEEDQVYPTTLEILQPGNAFLQDLVDGFLKKMRAQTNKTQIACFFEQIPSDVGKIVGKRERIRFVVSQDAGCLDLSESTNKHSLSRTHFEMNKFGNAADEDFEILTEVVTEMIKESPSLLWARSQYNGKHKLDFSLQGVPLVDHFVQRTAEMRELENYLLEKPMAANRRKVVIIHGLGGIGKTQLAVEFAREHHCRFSSVIWLDGSTETSLKRLFAGLAQRLPKDELTADGAEMLRHPTIDVEVAVRECLRWLSLPSNQQWLLIFDNVDRDFNNGDDPEAYNLKNYFPSADHGSILITSRLANLRKHGVGIRVGTVNAGQAKAILENNAGKLVEDANVVLERLKGLPLALTQAGSYIRETNISSFSYAEHYDKTWKRLMAKQERFPLEEYGNRNILTTWIISYEQVRTQSVGAAFLLKLWGFLDHGELWYQLIAASLDFSEEIEIPRWLLALAEDELEYREALGLLSRYSLADTKEGTDSHSMHTVLHKWCGQLAEGEERFSLGYIGVGLVVSYPSSKSEAEVWSKRQRLLAHALHVCGWITGEAMADKRGISENLIHPEWYYRLGRLLLKDARLKEAETMYEQGLFGYEMVLGAEHTSTLDMVNNLGMIYVYQGRLKEAEAMYERALHRDETALGTEYTASLHTVNNLGILYVGQGRLKEAEAMYERALHGYETALGAEHTSTLLAVSNLGRLYVDQGRLKEAEVMYERALHGYEAALGAEHTSTLNTVNDLGSLYLKTERLEEAEAMYERALHGYEKALGAEHTSTLHTINNLGILYVDQGRPEEAEAMYKRALRGKEKVLGEEHTATLSTVHNLGSFYIDQERLEEAEAMYKRALRGKEKALGADHISTLDTVSNLGSLYLRKGRLEEAEAMYERTLRGYEEAVSPANMLTFVPALDNYWGLASLFSLQNRIEDAKAFCRKALSGYEKVYGNAHPKCQALRGSIAAIDDKEDASSASNEGESL